MEVTHPLNQIRPLPGRTSGHESRATEVDDGIVDDALLKLVPSEGPYADIPDIDEIENLPIMSENLLDYAESIELNHETI